MQIVQKIMYIDIKWVSIHTEYMSMYIDVKSVSIYTEYIAMDIKLLCM